MSEQATRTRRPKRGNQFSKLVWVRDARTGERVKVRVTEPTARELDRKVRALQVQSEARKWHKPHRDLLADYLRNEYLPEVSKMSKKGVPLAPTTAAKYRDAVHRICKVIGDVPLDRLHEGHVTRLRDSLSDEGLSGSTVGDILRVLSQAMNRAVARRYIESNPAHADLVTRPKSDPAEFVVVDAALAERIRHAARGLDPWDAAVALALGCGLRREECLGLERRDVDLFDARTVQVRSTVTWAGGKLHRVRETKTDASERVVGLADQAVDALRRHARTQAERLLALGHRVGPEDLVIDAGQGEPFSPPTFSYLWRRFARQHDLRGPTPDGDERFVTYHGLRHGHATLLPDLGRGRLREHAAARAHEHSDA